MTPESIGAWGPQSSVLSPQSSVPDVERLAALRELAMYPSPLWLRWYFAARSSRRLELQPIARALMNRGQGITARWLAGQHDGDPERHGAIWAGENLFDIASADVFVLFSETPRSATRGGRLVEFGYALAHVKMIFIVGQNETIHGQLPRVHHVATAEQLIKLLDDARAGMRAMGDGRRATDVRPEEPMP